MQHGAMNSAAASLARRPTPWLLALAVSLLVACGGGGGGAPDDAPLANGDRPFTDNASYSSQPQAGLDGAVEGAAVTRHQITLGGRRIDYSAHAGHLITRDAAGTAQAKMFHVSYIADGAAAATRPVTFFYNGGPGSASVWLHLGSFGPRRLVTGVPGTAASVPYPLVDNAESLLDTSDLVFVNAVGSGYSQAIRPASNHSFWGVDLDAAVFRDFVLRWLQAFGRETSPRYLYGESYGGPRTAVLARLLEEGGVRLDGLVLQSPAMDYNSNCAVSGGTPAISCAGFVPSYGMTGAWHRLLTPQAPADDLYAQLMRDLARELHDPIAKELLAGRPAASVVTAEAATAMASATGLSENLWRTRFNLDPGTFQRQLLPGQLIGRYDARVAVPTGSALARDGDPSSTMLVSSFSSAIASYLRDTLRYRNESTYVLLSSAIQSWVFAHGGRALPDTLPDLEAAMRANPRLRVLAVSGYHDLATPFHVTELDLARLSDPARVTVRNDPGGHMSSRDDATRVRQKADLVAFYGAAPRLAAEQRRLALARPARPAVDRAGDWARPSPPPVPEPVQQAPLADPWVPPSQRVR